MWIQVPEPKQITKRANDMIIFKFPRAYFWNSTTGFITQYEKFSKSIYDILEQCMTYRCIRTHYYDDQRKSLSLTQKT